MPAVAFEPAGGPGIGVGGNEGVTTAVGGGIPGIVIFEAHDRGFERCG